MNRSIQWIDSDGLSQLFSQLRGDGYELIGPQVRDGVIVLGEMHGVDELPAGIGDQQAPGHYRLTERGDDALFGFNTTAQSIKPWLHKPQETVFTVERSGGKLKFVPVAPEQPKRAWIGARGCELAAMRIQDRVLMESQHADPSYAAGRAQLLVVAVNCGQAAETCFCTSMGTGPEVEAGYDLLLTEVLAATDPHLSHGFLLQSGSRAGAALLARLSTRDASSRELLAGEQAIARARATMGRELNTDGLAEQIYANAEHPHWQQVAEQCLACGNCTSVCPTCFCSSYEDRIELDGEQASRIRQWDSCFNSAFTHVAGGSVRESTASRYRQWLTHKLASWQDQFDTDGCVGCGRCITWCPVGIDITEQVRKFGAGSET